MPKKNKKMKKIITLVSVIGMFTFVSCGPSAAEIEAKAKQTADSVASATAAAEAELAAKAAEAEIAVLKEKAIADSIVAAEVAAKNVPQEPKKPTKPTPPKTIKEKVKEEVKKADQGRG